MKKIFMLLSFGFIFITAHAQSDIRTNSYLENGYYINPASINKNYTAEFSILARKQWVNFHGAPRSLYATATTYIESLNTQIGLKVFSDKIGYTSATNIALSYAYDIKLNREWNLLLGINGSYENFSYDLSQIHSSDQNDDVLFTLKPKKNYFNSDFGFEFRRKDRLKIGFSSKNMVSLFLGDEDYKKVQTNANYLYVRDRITLTDFIDLGLAASGIQYGKFYQLELNPSVFMRWKDDEYVQIGLLYRTKSELGFLIGFDVTPAFRIVYSYDYHTGGIGRNSTGTHEIMLVYRLGRIYQCINCW